MPLGIRTVSARDPQILALLQASHALMDHLFPPEENFALDVDALCARVHSSSSSPLPSSPATSKFNPKTSFAAATTSSSTSTAITRARPDDALFANAASVPAPKPTHRTLQH